MLAFPIKLLATVFGVALCSQIFDVYSDELAKNEVLTEKAMLYAPVTAAPWRQGSRSSLAFSSAPSFFLGI